MDQGVCIKFYSFADFGLNAFNISVSPFVKVDRFLAAARCSPTQGQRISRVPWTSSTTANHSVWVITFLCLRIRAMYLDIVQRIEVEEFLNALVRFTSFHPSLRRLHSDQGTNFLGAANGLRCLRDDHRVANNLVSNDLEWSMIAPHSPWLGGAWERLLGGVKQNLSSISARHMSMDRFQSVSCCSRGVSVKLRSAMASTQLEEAMLKDLRMLLARTLKPSTKAEVALATPPISR